MGEAPAQVLDLPGLRVWKNAGLGIYANTPGIYRIEVASGGDGTGTGTYQMEVRVNNFCIIVNGEPLYQCDGGAKGKRTQGPTPGHQHLGGGLHRQSSLLERRFPGRQLGRRPE